MSNDSTKATQARIQATLTDLDNTSFIGLAWESVRNILGITSVATRLATVVAVSEGVILRDTYVNTRLENLDKPKASTNKWFD